jgi:hypothetical protein
MNRAVRRDRWGAARSSRRGSDRVKRYAGLAVVLTVAAAQPAPAQEVPAQEVPTQEVPVQEVLAEEVSESQTGSAPEVSARALTVHEVKKREEEIGAKVDVLARFEEFQRDFEEDFGAKHRSDPGSDFGAKPRSDPGNDVATRIGKSLEKRWSGSAAFRLYERLEGVYDRGERVYKRLEASTRWATHGVSVDPDLEAAVNGKLRLNVQRRLGRFDMGLNVDDAISGKLGLRMGGVIRGYKVGLDVSDMINDGRISFQLRRMTK